METRVHKDLSFGYDCRGDYAFFVEANHFNGWKIDRAACAALVNEGDLVYFRKIQGGVETSTHGWIEGTEVVQWG